MKLFFVNDIQNSMGVIVTAGSTINLLLSQNTTTGSEPLTQTPIVIPIDNTGSASQEIWFNDEQLPANTFYNVTIVTPNYGIVYNQNVPITGASFNLASFVPGSQGSLSPVYIPALETNGTANANQTLLNLKAGSNITLTADSLGDVTIAAAGSNAGTANQIAYYAATGTAVSGNPRLTDSGTELTYTGATGINIPSGSGYIFNNDTVMSRLSANIIGFGNGVGQTNGTIEAAEFYSPGGSVYTGGGGGVTTSSLSVLGATATFGTAGTTSGVITLEGSTSGSCTITAPATAGTIANAIAVSNTINIPSGTSFSINGDAFLSHQGAGAFRIGTSVGGADGEITGAISIFTTFGSSTANPATLGVLRLASTDSISWRNAGNSGNYFLAKDASDNLTWNGQTLIIGTAGFSSGTLELTGSGSGTCYLQAPAVAGTTTNPIVFSNCISVPPGLLTAPSVFLTASNGGTQGFWCAGLGNVNVVSNGVDVFNFNTAQIRVSAGLPFGFCSGTSGASGLDTGFSRTAAKNCALGNGTQADTSGILTLTGITPTIAAGSYATTAGEIAAGYGGAANLGMGDGTNARRIPMTLYSGYGFAATGNVTGFTSLFATPTGSTGSLTLVANQQTVGSTLHICARGTMTVSTATQSCFFESRLKTGVLSEPGISLTTAAITWEYDSYTYCSAVGAAGVATMQTVVFIKAYSSTTIAANTTGAAVTTLSSTVDTTTTQLVDLLFAFGASEVGNTMTCTWAEVTLE